MKFQFNNDPVQIPRAEHLTADAFKLRYRNKYPVILSDVISDWLPKTKWTIDYLQKALEQDCDHELIVFVSHDNRQFINHPEVTQTITTTPHEFLRNVFECNEKCDIPELNAAAREDERQRYYLRTFSMPDILFEDIDVPSQIKSLLDVVCFIKDENAMNNEEPNALKTRDKEAGLRDAQNCESESYNEMLSPWEEMLSPRSSCATSDATINDDSSAILSTEPSCFSPSPIIQLESQKTTHLSKSKESDVMNVIEKSGHHHGSKSVSLACREMYTSIFNQSTMQLWIGTRGNVTPLHYDRNHGLLAQVVGRKELILFSHEDTVNVYPHVSYSERAHTSRVNLHELDVTDNARFPKLRIAQPYHCILKPGELLYMPPFWWHDVTYLDDCISVTLPWDVRHYEEIPACMMT